MDVYQQRAAAGMYKVLTLTGTKISGEPSETIESKFEVEEEDEYDDYDDEYR